MESELFELLRQFVAFETIAGKNDVKVACLDWIQKNFLSLHKNVERSESDETPYLLHTHTHPKLLWFAHIDVVPAPEKLFSIWREGDRIQGRGVKDMKGATLPFLLAYRDTCAAGTIPPVSILLTSDEEIGGRSIPELLERRRIAAPVAFTPDTGSAASIVTEHKGGVWADLIAHGKGAHGGMPWEGENPIFLLAQAITSIQHAFPVGTGSDWQITVSPTKLEGSDARNKIPAEARCSLDVRFPPSADANAETVIEQITHVLPHGCSLDISLILDPLSMDPNHPMVQRIKRLASDITGEEVTVGREHGATDARHFSKVGIPAFLYGPTGGNLHQDDEWVSMQSLLHQYELGKRLLQELIAGA